MTGRRSLLSLSGSLALHGLAVLAALAWSSRESLPAVMIVELGEAIRVGGTASAPGAAGGESRPPRVRERPRRPVPVARAEVGAEPLPPERIAAPGPSPRERDRPPTSPDGEATKVMRADGGSIPDAVGGGLPRGGPLVMLVPSFGGEGGGGAATGLTARGTGAGEGGIPAGFGLYLARFRQRIQEALYYPLSARRRGLAGTVQLEIELLPTGRVAAVVLLSSSSHSVLDEAAMDTVKRLSPGPFPPEVPPRPLRVRLPIVFGLK